MQKGMEETFSVIGTSGGERLREHPGPELCENGLNFSRDRKEESLAAAEGRGRRHQGVGQQALALRRKKGRNFLRAGEKGK